MVSMYDKNVDADFYNITLDGYHLIMEDFSPNESFNRRETIRHKILGGTESVMRGNYLPRDFNFTTHFLIDPDFPDVYDDILREWQSKPVEVISKYMGGKFKAEVIIKKAPTESPNYLTMEIQVIEIPEEKSLIPKDEFNIPKDVITPVTISSSKKKSSSKSSKKKSSSKNSNKSSKQKKKDKKKGKNITKAKKNG